MRFRKNAAFGGRSFVGVARSSSPDPAMNERRPTMKNEGATEIGLNYAIGLNRRLLTPLGVWPLRRNASKSEKTARKIRIVITLWIISLHMMPQYLNILLNERNTEGYLQIAAPQVFDVLAMVKFYFLIKNADKIGYCVTYIEKDWMRVKLEEDKRTMYSNAKVGRYLTIFCIGFMYGGLIPYNVFLPFLNARSEGNVSYAGRPLAHPTTYVVLDEQSTPIYEITLVVQFIGSGYLSALNCGVYTLTGVLVAHACGQLQIIASRFDDLIRGDRGEFPNVQQRMNGIFQHHSSVIRYAEHVNQAFQVTFLTDEIGALAVICFVGYMAVTTWSRCNSVMSTLIWLILMIATTFNIFVLSFAGQLLRDKSQEVGLATARVPWYRMQPKIARPLILCMARSARPLKLSAFNMFELSLANFGEVLKGSFVFLNMIRQVTKIE